MVRKIVLTDEQREQLAHVLKSDSKAYRRERAAAILKVADGQIAAHVARSGLLRVRDPDTVYSWLDRFQEYGIAGLSIRSGRGRKRRFSPQIGDGQQALLDLVRRDPHQCAEPRSRWTLEAIRRVCTWLQSYSLSGIWRVLEHCDIHWKRGRDHVYSPDPYYEPKLARVAEVRQRIARPGSPEILLFLDELTYYRQPTLAYAYEQAGHTQPLAERSYRSNTPTRVVAALNALTGEVTHHQAKLIGVQELIHFYEALCQRYPSAQRIFVVQDNWPVHFHPDVLVALQPQENPWPWVLPAHWTTQPSRQARRLNLSVQILPLPTYAPWTNPVEKLWRWLKQDVLHLHRLADDLTKLRRQVAAFLDQFALGSHALLRYVGLLVPNSIVKVHESLRREAGKEKQGQDEGH